MEGAAAGARQYPSHWKGTVVAVNVGGAVIPTLVSIYLLMKRDLWVKGLVGRSPISLAASAPLIGADLTNLDMVRGLGAPVASIGGAPPRNSAEIAEFLG
jgi:uncharacterized membrane protein